MTSRSVPVNNNKPKFVHHVAGIFSGLAVAAAIIATAYFVALSPEEQQRFRISIGFEQAGK